jgi:hypothetical protein
MARMHSMNMWFSKKVQPTIITTESVKGLSGSTGDEAAADTTCTESRLVACVPTYYILLHSFYT